MWSVGLTLVALSAVAMIVGFILVIVATVQASKLARGEKIPDGISRLMYAGVTLFFLGLLITIGVLFIWNVQDGLNVDLDYVNEPVLAVPSPSPGVVPPVLV